MDSPLRGSAATSRNTTGCPSWSGASPDRAFRLCSFASSPLGLCPRRGGAGSRNQGGIHDRYLPHRHSIFAEVDFDSLLDEVFCVAIDLLVQIVLLQ